MATITEQLKQNALIEQIVLLMSTKFNIDNKEASEFVFEKLSIAEDSAAAIVDEVVVKVPSKRSKKVAVVVAKEVVKAPSKKSKYLSTSEINELLEDGPLRSDSYADVTEVVVKAVAKKSKKVDVTVDTAAIVDEVVVKAPAKKSKKVAVLEAEVVVAKDDVEKEVVSKAPVKRSKKVDATVDTASIVDEVVVKAVAKKSKKVDADANTTTDESSGDESKKDTKLSKKNKKAETLKPVELVKITEAELQEDPVVY